MNATTLAPKTTNYTSNKKWLLDSNFWEIEALLSRLSSQTCEQVAQGNEQASNDIFQSFKSLITDYTQVLDYKDALSNCDKQKATNKQIRVTLASLIDLTLANIDLSHAIRLQK